MNSKTILMTGAISMMALIAAGCATQPYGNGLTGNNAQGQYNSGQGQLYGKPNQARNAAIGAAAGAALGQVLGGDTEATVTGAAVGGLIGSQVNTPQ